MPRKSATVAEAVPTAGCLTFSFEPSLLGESAAAKIAEHYRDCCEFEGKWADLRDRRLVLLQQADDVLHGLLVSTAREILDERVALQAALDGLFVQRRQLCEALVGDAADASEKARADHERVLAEVAADLAQKGVVPEAFSGYSSNPRAGERQYRYRLENSDEAVGSLGRCRRIEAAAREVASVAQAGDATVSLRWGGVPAQHKKLAEFLELADDTVSYQLRLNVGVFA